MAIRQIITREDDTLLKKCRPVVKFDEKLWELLGDMQETLSDSGGLGLAAPQIGILRCVAIVLDEEYQPIELVNPKIIGETGEQRGLEGCLSIPNMWGFVTRPQEVTVEAQNRHGEFFQVTKTDLVARCLCHEINHLDGVLYTEHCDVLYTSQEIEEMEQEES